MSQTISPAVPPIADAESRLRVPRLPEGPRRFRADHHPTARRRLRDFAASYDGADLVVVNTCGFIDEAVQESLDAIGEALAENGKVIVTGCLGAKKSASGTG